MMLEFSQYLENYLWPNYDPTTSTPYHILSIVIMVNEKFRERVSPWQVFCNSYLLICQHLIYKSLSLSQIFQKLPDNFPHLFNRLMEMTLDENRALNFKEQTCILVFLNHSFNSLEVDLIRDQVQRLVSLPIWTCLPEVHSVLLFSYPYIILCASSLNL